MMDLARISTIVRLIADTSRRCNLRCWYCHSTSGPDYPGPEIQNDQLAEILSTAERLRVFDITVTGGEPALWPGLLRLMEESQQIEFARLQLITNATLVTDRVLSILERGKLARICVSLDGLEMVHNRNRGEGIFKCTVEGILRLRQVVDNLTVVTVIDRTTAQRWPELTHLLIDLGVKQHHLAPVCFAGNAMNAYRGLTAEQFVHVRTEVQRMAAQLPIKLVFNDSMVGGIASRTMPINTFTEWAKGWHVIIRPDGKVKTSIRAWGRTWRANEVLGDVNEQPLVEILAGFSERVSHRVAGHFAGEEERRRKFHLGATAHSIQSDLADVRTVEAGGQGERLLETETSVDLIALPLGLDLDALAAAVIATPANYRLREEDGFAFLFDGTTFEVSILTSKESERIAL